MIGQSGSELLIAVFFSFFLHAALVALTLILVTVAAPKVHIPLFYEVKLVGQPQELAPSTPPAAAPSLPKAEPATVREKIQPKIKQAAPKPAATAKKGDMPELATPKSKPIQRDETKPSASEEAKPVPKEEPSASNVPAATPATPVLAVSKAEGVAVSTASGDSKQLSSYSQIILQSIGRNWNPPPGVRGLKAKVLFKVLRTGRVFGDVNIEESSGNTYFDMAAKRAILSSNPFPSLPEEFYKQYAEFTVDLQEKY
jgi:TonB family protein